MLGYSISGVLGGVSEPALYGCGFKYGRCLTCMAIGGAVGGLVAAVGHVTAYTIGMTNVLMVIGFATGGISNLLWCCVAGGTAFAASAALSYCFGVVPTKGRATGGRSRFTRNLEERGRSKRVNLCDTRTIPLPYSRPWPVWVAAFFVSGGQSGYTTIRLSNRYIGSTVGGGCRWSSGLLSVRRATVRAWAR